MLENKEEKLNPEEQKVKEQVEEIMTTSFNIQGVPIKVFKRFLKFCENNAQITKIFRDKTGQKQIRKELCYSIALAQLLDISDTDGKHQLLFERLVKLEEKVYGSK